MDQNNQPQPPPLPGDVPAGRPSPPGAGHPVGLILIIILTGLGMVGGLMTLVNPVLIVGPFVLDGAPAFLYGLILEGVYIALFILLIKRKNSGRILGIGVSIYNVLLATTMFLVQVFNPDGTWDTYKSVIPGQSDLVTPTFFLLLSGAMVAFSWVIGCSVIAYLYFKRQHFKS